MCSLMQATNEGIVVACLGVAENGQRLQNSHALSDFTCNLVPFILSELSLTVSLVIVAILKAVFNVPLD